MYIFDGCTCPVCAGINKVSTEMASDLSFSDYRSSRIVDIDTSSIGFSFPGIMIEKTYHKNFSAGKAAFGAFIAGPIGLAAGALGKEAKYYKCTKCGFTCDSNGNRVNL